MSRLAVMLLVSVGVACASVDPQEIRVAALNHDTVKLYKWLDHSHVWVREDAARALGQVGAPEAARRLEAIVGDGNESSWVRVAALDGLGALRDPASLPVVVGAASAPGTEPEVKLAALAAACQVDPKSAPTLIAPLVKDEDLLVAAFAENLLRSRCVR